MNEALIILFFGVAFAFFWFVSCYEERQRSTSAERIQRLQSDRELRTATEFGYQCEQQLSSDTIERVLRVLATVSEFSFQPEIVNVDPNRLRPDDSVFDLGYDLDSLAFFELETALEKEFDISIHSRDLTALNDGDVQHPPTVADILRLVASKLQEQAKAR